MRMSALLFASLSLTCCADKQSGANAQNTTAHSANESPSMDTQKPALGIAIPTLQFADDVKKYMRELLAAPIPAGYQLPADILNETVYETAVAKVNEHFPEFVNLESDDLLRAVKSSPLRYQSLILEAKCVREKFFPGSQPKPH
jgi:hypothetical protein